MAGKLYSAVLLTALVGCAAGDVAKPVAVSKARECKLTPVPGSDHDAGTGITLTMTVSSSGGWCSAPHTWYEQVARMRYPYSSLSWSKLPAHGTVQVRQSNVTFVDYQPTPGYKGPDSFSYRMQPGNGYYTMDVTVVE